MSTPISRLDNHDQKPGMSSLYKKQSTTPTYPIPIFSSIASRHISSTPSTPLTPATVPAARSVSPLPSPPPKNLGETEDSTSDPEDWVEVEAPATDHSSLLSYEKVGGEFKFSLHTVLSQPLYDSIRLLNEFSYVLANCQSPKNPEKAGHLALRSVEIKRKLIELGWDENFPVFIGETGSDRDPDASCVAACHQKWKVVLITWHGSRNGSKIPYVFGSDGDWGDNYNFSPETAGNLGLDYVKEDIQVHGGFGHNFKSVQNQVYGYLEEKLTSMNQNLKETWVIASGHSKGAGVATIATFAMKEFLKQSSQFKDVQAGSLVFSSPRVFAGDASIRYVHNIVGKRNMLRLNVYGDPVPQTPLKILNFRSVGTLILDTLSNVRTRGNELSTSPSSVPDVNFWSGVHYAGNLRNAGLEFDQRLLPSHGELTILVNAARQHDPASFGTPSFLGLPSQ
jgi:hypothetical protein